MLFLVIALLVFITQTLFMHWWLIAVDTFVAALLLAKGNWNAFLSGFFGVGLVWLGAAFYWDYQNEGLLMGKIAQLFKLPAGEWVMVLTVLIGALVGGLSALTGYSLRALFQAPKS
jgi:hypothetical protein